MNLASFNAKCCISHDLIQKHISTISCTLNPPSCTSILTKHTLHLILRGHPRRLSSLSPVKATTADGQPEQPSTPTPTFLSHLASFVSTNFIPCGLVSAMIIGWSFPAPGVAAAAINLQRASLIGIFIISGLLLEQGEALAALRSTKALAYGLTAILLVTPFFGLVAQRIPLYPPEMAVGLAFFCCMPTTLSAGVALTQLSKGNVAVALLLTVVSNALGVFSIPIVLPLVLGSAFGGGVFEGTALFKSLVATVLLPLIAGATAQMTIPAVKQWRVNNKKLLAYLSALCLCMVPWMQVSKASFARLPLTVTSVLAAALAGATVHVAMLLTNIVITSFIRFAKDDKDHVAIRKAVVLCSSQKTLPVAVAVLSQLSGLLGSGAGVAVIPCVLTHLLQTVIDSVLVAQWNKGNMVLT